MTTYLIIDMLTELIWNWGPWIYNKTIDILELCPKIYNAVYKDIYGAKGWLFIKESKIPISEELFDTNGIQQYLIKWKATTEPPIFKDPRYSESRETHISYLGLSVIDPGNKILDLTDWINELKWSGLVQPSPAEIFSLWCCKNKSHLMYCSSNLIVEIITENGDIIKKGLNEFTHTNTYEDDGTSQTDRPDPNRHLDLVLSSSGR